MKYSKKGFSTLLVFLFGMVSIAIITGLYYYGFASQSKIAYKTDLIIAKLQNKVAYEDALASYLGNKEKYYRVDNISPCVKNSGPRPFIGLRGDNLEEYFGTLNSKETLPNNVGFVDRRCSIFSKGLPHKLDSDFSFHKSASDFSSQYSTKNDENGLYNIGIIYDNTSKGYIFSSDMISTRKLTIALDYNHEDLYDSNINIFLPSKSMKEKIELVKKQNPNLDLTKKNLKDVLEHSLNFQNADLEIGVIEFDGSFNQNGFQITPGSSIIPEMNIKANGENKTAVKERVICKNNYKNCSIEFDIQPNKIYAFYLKSFDLSTTYRVDFQDNFGSSIYIPTDKLYVESYGYSNERLLHEQSYIDLSLYGGLYSNFDSGIYNYVFFSNL